MEKIILALTAALSLAISAHANLGDTYAQSCERFGGKGTISGKQMVWAFSEKHYLIYEMFSGKICVGTMLVPEKGFEIPPALAANFMKAQAPQSEWHEGTAGDMNICEWYTNDGLYVTS
jgi:hypothetical protein